MGLGASAVTKGVPLALLDKALSIAGKSGRDQRKRDAKKGITRPLDARARALAAISEGTHMALSGDVAGLKKLAVNSFAAALSTPFEVQARGARVPDMYAFPTNTYRIQTSVLLGAGATTFGGVFLPNPYVSMLDITRMSGLGTSVSSTGGMRPYTGATAFFGSTTPALLSALSTEFRVVGGGIKIRNLIPELTATGRIYLAVIPVANGGVPSYALLDTIPFNSIAAGNPAYNNVLARMGLPNVPGLSSASLQMQPVSKDFTVGEIVGSNELEVDFAVYHPDLFRFKASDAANVGLDGVSREADDIVFTIALGSVSTTASGFKEPTQSDGGSAIILWCEGFPGGVSPQIEVDYVLHLETIPLVAVGGVGTVLGITPESSNPPIAHIGTTAMVEAEINRSRLDPNSIIREQSSVKGSGGASVGRSRR